MIGVISFLCGGSKPPPYKATDPHKSHVHPLISVILSVRQPRRILKGFFAYLIATYTQTISFGTRNKQDSSHAIAAQNDSIYVHKNNVWR